MADSFFSMADEPSDVPNVDTPDIIDTPDSDNTSDDLSEEIELNTTDAPNAPDVSKKKIKPNNSYIDSMAEADVERLASEIGWNPKGKKNAKDWLRNSDNYVFKTKDVMESMQKEIASIKELNIKQIQNAREQERNNLKNILKKLGQDQIEAVELSDADAVNDIIEQKDIVKQKIKEYEAEEENFKKINFQQNQDEVYQQVREFVDANPWYETDDLMKARYENILQGYLNAGVKINKAMYGAKEDLERLYPKVSTTNKENNNPPRGDMLSSVSGQRQPSNYGLTSNELVMLDSEIKDLKDYMPNIAKDKLEAFKKTTINEIKRLRG